VNALKFVDSAFAERLNLDTTTGWVLLQGFDPGNESLESSWLFQGPYPGAIPTAFRQEIVTMSIPLGMFAQSSYAAVKVLYEALVTELTRSTNILRFTPDGSTVYYFDTYRAAVPTLFPPVDDAANSKHPHPITLSIPRHPVARGVGAYI